MSAQSPEPDDDMHDPRDRSAPFPLGDYLKLCDPCAEGGSNAPCLRHDFDAADAEALHAQRKYNWTVRIAAVLGILAMLIGLGQRLQTESAAPIVWIKVEFFYTLIALVFVLVAMLSGDQEHWLGQRFRAERLRLLKFKLLISPELWRSEPRNLPAWRNRLETGQREIANQTDEVLEAIRISDAISELPKTADCVAVEPEALERLIDYYRRKRLGVQLRYFERSMHRESLIANPRLPSLAFFLGIALLLSSDLVEWVTSRSPSTLGRHVSLWLVLFAFAVPMGWSAFRIIRGAFEISRNAARSHARHAALAEISRSLDDATAGPLESWDRARIFGTLSLCEGVLASDQHEWIRLMKDVEWHG